MEYKTKKIVILGAGKSGIAARNLATYLGFSVQIYDENKKEFLPYSQQFEFDDAEYIIVSPGIPQYSEMLKMAEMSGKSIISELEFASRYTDLPIIAITGTNGKTTTVELLSYLLNCLSIFAITAGNIGTPLAEVVLDRLKDKKSKHTPKTVIITEVSSFQLEKPNNDREFSFSPFAAAIINISSDHLDRYSSIKEYASTKFKIFRNIKNPKRMVINETLAESAKEYGQYPSDEMTLFGFDKDNSLTVFCDKNRNIFLGHRFLFNINNTLFESAHNTENLMTALALLSSIIEIDTTNSDILIKSIKEFKIGSHRQEIILKKNGILYIDDSKATNPAATIASLNKFGNYKNICLILGGLDKDMDFSALLQTEKHIKKAFIIGSAKKKIAQIMQECNIELETYDSFDSAVKNACHIATEGDVVLLSPACASMDMFKNYRERGERFRKIVKQNFTP